MLLLLLLGYSIDQQWSKTLIEFTVTTIRFWPLNQCKTESLDGNSEVTLSQVDHG